MDAEGTSEKRILILGGSSFIGTWIARTTYFFYNFTLTYFTHTVVTNYFPEFTWYQVDTTTGKALKNVIEKTSPEIVINTAAIADPRMVENDKASKKINVDSNKEIAKLADKMTFFPIFISTDHVFHGDAGPYNENDPLDPVTPYGEQKKEAESYYLQLIDDKSAAIVRSSVLFGYSYGWHRRRNILEKLQEAAITREVIPVTENKFRTVSHVINLAFMLHSIMDHDDPIAGIFHLPGTWISEEEFFRKIIAFNNYDIKLAVSTNTSVNFPKILGLRTDETYRKLHFRVLTLEEGLKLPQFFF